LPVGCGSDSSRRSALPIGVSGAPGGGKDEACAKARIDKISAELK
jgi:hypothetical protein